MEKCPEAQRLPAHPGVGGLTALAYVLIIGRADRFECGNQIASYLAHLMFALVAGAGFEPATFGL